MTLAKLKELAQKATPGPWTYTKDRNIAFGKVLKNTSNHICIEKGGGWLMEDLSPDWHNPKDPKYIAAANPAIILELIERYEKVIHMLQLWLSSTPTKSDGTYCDINQWHSWKANELLKEISPDVPFGEGK